MLMVMFNVVTSKCSGRAACGGERCLFALLFCMLMRSTCADAEEARDTARLGAPPPVRPHEMARHALEPPRSLGAFDTLRPADPAVKFGITQSSAKSTLEFRPRGPSVSTPTAVTPEYEFLPPLRDRNVWERMSDFKTSRGIRLLTLWESTRSTLSLQAGHGGGPSLQWTSRSFGRGAGTRSLLDHLFSTTIGSTTIGDAQPLPRAGKAAPRKD